MKNNNLKKEFIKDMLFGALVLGVLLVLYVILSMTYTTINKWVLTAVLFVLCFAIPFYVGNEFKKKVNPSGRFPFSKAFLLTFSIMIIAGIIASIGQVVYTYYLGADVVIANQVAALEAAGQQVVQVQLDAMNKIMNSPFTLFGISFLSYLCPAIILSPIIAALTNKKEKDVVAEFDQE